jgi:hypothetical protein
MKSKSQQGVEFARTLFDRTLEDLDKDVPDWQTRALFMVLKMSLHVLKAHLNDPKSGVSWQEPFVQFHYPIEIDWDSWETPPMVVRFVTGQFSPRNTKTKNRFLVLCPRHSSRTLWQAPEKIQGRKVQCYQQCRHFQLWHCKKCF